MRLRTWMWLLVRRLCGIGQNQQCVGRFGCGMWTRSGWSFVSVACMSLPCCRCIRCRRRRWNRCGRGLCHGLSCWIVVLWWMVQGQAYQGGRGATKTGWNRWSVCRLRRWRGLCGLGDGGSWPCCVFLDVASRLIGSLVGGGLCWIG